MSETNPTFAEAELRTQEPAELYFWQSCWTYAAAVMLLIAAFVIFNNVRHTWKLQDIVRRDLREFNVLKFGETSEHGPLNRCMAVLVSKKGDKADEWKYAYLAANSDGVRWGVAQVFSTMPECKDAARG